MNMNTIGIAIMVFGGLLWFFGGIVLWKQHLRRIGQVPFFMALLHVSIKDFNSAEKRKLFWLFITTLLLCFIGSNIANGVFG
jgi:hypothetical protein